MSVWYRMLVLSDSASKYEIAVSSSQIVTWRVNRLAYGFPRAFEKSGKRNRRSTRAEADARHSIAGSSINPKRRHQRSGMTLVFRYHV